MNTIWIRMWAAVFALGASSCSSDSNDDVSSQETVPGPRAFDKDFATSDEFFTNMTEPAEGLASSPHGVVQIYYSKNIEELISSASFTAPEGTVAIKTQSYDSAGEYEEILVMIKMESGFDPGTNDWLYEVRDAVGDVRSSGGDDLAFCSQCHGAFTSTDHLPGIGLSN